MALKLTGLDPDPNSRRDEERKAELTEHLAELRTRLIRACLYVVVGMGVMWVLSGRVQMLVMAPINNIVHHLASQPSPQGQLPNGGFIITNFTDGFFLKLQIATVGGLILALPFALLELWGFVAPALTPAEKKGIHFVAPMSILLFFMGAACAYFILPRAAGWFLSYMPPGAILLQNPLTWTVFFVKILLVFGLMFELPVVLMFLGKIGIINSALMVRYWRQIAVGLFTIAMVVAPSNDPGTMLALAIPLTLLFFGSIGLVKLVEPKPIA
ncbi:MAG: twin-arginine translocase subunit TatC [Janthinobacterium lividum]